MTNRLPAPERRVLRRIEAMALGYGLLGGLLWLLGRGWKGALVLTLTAAASIVAFRGLEVFSLLLEPRQQGNLGALNTLLITLRLVFLAGVVVAALIFGARHGLALIAGFSVLPAALMTEAVVEVCGLVRGGREDGR